MKNKNIISIIFSVFLSFAFVVVAVNAASTISTNISTGGTLTVTGLSSLGNASTTLLTVSNKSYLGTVSSGVWQGTAIGDSYLTKSGDWTGTFDSQEGSYYLNAGNLTNFGTPFYTYFNATTTSALTEGTNLYWTNTRFDNRLSATTTLPNLTTLVGLSITKSQVSDFGTYENPLTFNYPLTRATNAISIVATSSMAINTDNLVQGSTNKFMTYPGVGIALSTGSAWGSSITDNSANWNTAYTNRITSATYPLQISSNVISTTFSTTTANTFSALNIFDNASTTQLSVSSNLYLGTGTTTASNGFNISAGCFAIDGTCVGGSTYTATYPVTLTGSVFGMAFGTTTSNTWAGTQTFGTLAGTIDAGDVTSFEIPNAAAPTVGVTGQIGLDTTSGQLKVYNGAVQVYKPERYVVFGYATSTAWTGTTTMLLAPAYIGETWTGVKCETDVGTLNVSIYDGTNRMNMFNASTTIGTVTLSTNNTFTASESRRVDFGTPATAPTKVSCKASYGITAD